MLIVGGVIDDWSYKADADCWWCDRWLVFIRLMLIVYEVIDLYMTPADCWSRLLSLWLVFMKLMLIVWCLLALWFIFIRLMLIVRDISWVFFCDRYLSFWDWYWFGWVVGYICLIRRCLQGGTGRHQDPRRWGKRKTVPNTTLSPPEWLLH